MVKTFIYGLLLCCLATSLSGQMIDCDNTQHITSLENKTAKFTKERALDSLIYYTKPLVQCYQSKDSLAEWAMLYFNLANVARHTDTPTAIAYLDGIFTHSRYRPPVSKREQAIIVRVLMFKAHIQKSDSRYTDALISYEKAVEQYELYQLTPLEVMKLTKGKFKVHEHLFKPYGNIYTRLGDNEKARNILKKALAIGIELEDWESVAGNYLNIGITYWDQGNNENALQHYEKGLAVDSVSSYRRAMLFAKIAVSYHEISNNKDALKAANTALENCRASTHRQIPVVLAGINEMFSSIAIDKQKYNDAQNYINKAIKIKKDIYNENTRELGKTYIQQAKIHTAKGKYHEAIEAANRALIAVLPIFNPQKISDLPSDSLFYTENTIFEALSEKADAYAAWYAESKDLNHLQIALQCHELALKSEFKLRNVYQYESSKLNQQAHTRQRTEKAIDIAYLLYQKTNNEAYINRAFRLSESSRAVLLLEGISKNFIKTQALSDTLFSIENELKRQHFFYLKSILNSQDSATIAYNTAQKLKIEKDLDIINKKIEQRYPQYNNELNNRLSNISIQVVKNALPQNTDMVEYFQTKDAFYAFKINQKNTDFIKIKTTPEDINTIKMFLTLFEKDDIRAYTEPYTTLAHEVYQIIYKPLSISTDNEVVIIPEGILSTLPFDALLTSKSESKFFNTLPYLLQQNHINYAYSATIFLQKNTKNNPTKKKGVLALAPVFKNTDKELTKSEQEVDKIIKILSGKSLKHDKATQQAFTEIAPDYNIIHLSTHANAGNSGLPPQIEFSDKTMFLPELYALQLNAELAVLSACQTALGKHEQGEGVMSLARGFTYSGVPRLVTSLWKVDDVATAHIMTYFYQNLKAGMLTDKALHQAKLNYLKTAPDISQSPYFWSGLVHIGQPSTLDAASSYTKTWYLIPTFLLMVIATFLYRRKEKSQH